MLLHSLINYLHQAGNVFISICLIVLLVC